MSSRRVPVAEVALTVPPESLGVGTTADVEPLDGVVGQSRAREAVDFSLTVDNPHFNLFVAGATGTGRSSLLPVMAQRATADRPTPSDLCYVHNFEEPHEPMAIRLPAGQGREFAREMRRFEEALQRSIPAALVARDCRARQQAILEETIDRRREHFEKLEARGREVGVGVEDGPDALQLMPLLEDGSAMSPEDYEALDESERRAIEDRERSLRDDILEYLDHAREIQDAGQEQLDELDRTTVDAVVAPLMARVRDAIDVTDTIGAWLDAAAADVLEHLGAYVPDEESPLMDPRIGGPPATRFVVNVVVDNSEQSGGPVVVEWNPTWSNLFGRLERRMRFGALETDHTLLRAGAVHRADGGVLILPAAELVNAPGSWPTLKRMLREGCLAIGDPDEHNTAVTLDAQPVSIRVRVVLIGSLDDYVVLRELDEDFHRLFKVRADFEEVAPRDEDHTHQLVRFCAARCVEHGLPPMTAPGVAAVIEFASRVAGRRDEVTLRLTALADLIVEAGHLAVSRGAERVDRDDVQRALANRERRDGLYHERTLLQFSRRSLLVEVDGERVGQVNGLAVIGIGEIGFGIPSRITARAFAGAGGVVNIERETEMSGQIHSKATLILQGWIGGLYARRTPLSLSASVTFEQNYSFIDGDSASLAEAVAILSSVGELPVRQNLAITGSMSQHGEAQPVGGINEKIEGFFDVCAERGLTGEQGVVIPVQNVAELNLAPRVVAAIGADRFHVHAVESVDDALGLLLARTPGKRRRDGTFAPRSVHGRVAAALARMSEGDADPASTD